MRWQTLDPWIIPLVLALISTATLGFYPPHVHIFTSDGLEQMELARCLAAGGGLGCSGLRYWPPLFAVATMVAGAPLGSVEAGARLVAVVAAGLSPALAYDLSRRLARGAGLYHTTAAGLGAAGLTFAAPHLLFYGTMGDNRALYLLLVTLVAWCGARVVEAPRLGWAAAGVAAALGALARPEGRALIPVAVAVAAGAVWRAAWPEAPWRRIGRGAAAGAVAAGAAVALLLPYALALRALSGGGSLEPRRWEMAVMGWANYIPKDLILGLMGYTVHGTPLRARLLEALAGGDVAAPGPAGWLASFAAVYAEHVPQTLALFLDAIPTWLLFLAPVGAAALAVRRRWVALCMLTLMLAPYLLFPGLPQSSNDKVPSGNFLSALIPLATLAAMGVTLAMDRARARWVVYGLPATALALSALGTAWAVESVARVDADLHLFEGHALPRGAGEAAAALLPQGGRLVATYPGTAVAHFAGWERTPMPTAWEMEVAMERWRDRPTLFVLVYPDIYDQPLMVADLMRFVPDPCRPVLHSRGDEDDWVFACRIGPP